MAPARSHGPFDMMGLACLVKHGQQAYEVKDAVTGSVAR